MNEGPVNHGGMIETTDYLEAIGVFRGWKNLFFVILVIGLILLQAAFWLVDLKVVPASGPAPAAVAPTPPADANAVAKAPADLFADPNRAEGRTGIGELSTRLIKNLDEERLARIISLINGILIVTAVLYVLAMFFNLLISLVGRLGGIRHISRAFFLGVIMLVLIIPWQTLVGSRLPGVIYTLPELLDWMTIKDKDMTGAIIYYVRFSGYWLVFILLLLISQMRSARWTKSILRRLEII